MTARAVLVGGFVLLALVTSSTANASNNRALRPYEAPLVATPGPVPSLPPEYSSDEADGISFHYHPSARQRVRALIEQAAAARKQLSKELGRKVLASLQIRVAVGAPDFDRIAPKGAPSGSASLAYSQLGLVVMSLQEDGEVSSDTVLRRFRRALAFISLDEVTRGAGLPRWLRMGYALRFSQSRSFDRTRGLWWASMQQRLIPVVDLDWYLGQANAHHSLAAAEAADYVGFLSDAERRGSFSRLMDRIAAGASFDEALRQVYQTSPEALETAWRQNLARHKAFVPMLIGSTALWLLVALGASIRRRLRSRRFQEEEEEEFEIDPPRSSQAPSSRVKAKKARKTKKKLIDMVEPTEPEVPKVSHDGDWHTLH